MNRIRQRRVLATLNTVVFLALGLTLAAGAWLWRTQPVWNAPPWRPALASQPTLQAPAAPRVEELAAIWRRDLRQPLVDPPAPVPAAEPPPNVRLVGTAIEHEQRYGLFQLANNATVLKPVGAQFEGFEVLAIERGRARLRAGARELELTVPWYERLRAAGLE